MKHREFAALESAALEPTEWAALDEIADVRELKHKPLAWIVTVEHAEPRTGTM